MKHQSLKIDHQAHADKLAELGRRLQMFRQDQGLSLQEVEVKTKIPVRSLRAIEEGNLQQLPEPVYIQGFLRRYADAMGIDGAELAIQFPMEPIIAPRRVPWRLSFNAQLRPLHLYLLYTVLVAGAVGGLSHTLSRPSAPTVGSFTAPNPSGPQSPAPSIAGNLARSGSATGAESPAQQKSSLNSKSIRIGVTMTEQSWVRVDADGKTLLEEVLQEGTQRTWEADKQLTVRAGNAGGIMIRLNDGSAKPLGAPGEVKEVTFGARAEAASLPTDATVTLGDTRQRLF